MKRGWPFTHSAGVDRADAKCQASPGLRLRDAEGNRRDMAFTLWTLHVSSLACSAFKYLVLHYSISHTYVHAHTHTHVHMYETVTEHLYI